MAKTGINVKFLRTGLTLNSRVFVKGEVETLEKAFKNVEPLSKDTQIEIYGQIFYEMTDDPVTDPRRFVGLPQEDKLTWRPQMAEAGAARADGQGDSEIRGRSASSTPAPLPKDVVQTSDLPLLPPSKSERERERLAELRAAAEKEGKLIFSFPKAEKNVGGRKKSLVAATATQLSQR